MSKRKGPSLDEALSHGSARAARYATAKAAVEVSEVAIAPPPPALQATVVVQVPVAEEPVILMGEEAPAPPSASKIVSNSARSVKGGHTQADFDKKVNTK